VRPVCEQAVQLRGRLDGRSCRQAIDPRWVAQPVDLRQVVVAMLLLASHCRCCCS
jgi:hypothetical protein